MSTIVGDNAAAVDFLKKVYPDGPWVVTAIRLDRKAIDTETFRPATEADLLTWLQTYNGERNIYWSTNLPTRDLTKKAEREDIKEVAYLHVDVDPRAGEDLEAERKRILGVFAKADPEPTVVLFSGGGYQAFWKLETPILVNGDLKLAEDAKLYNVALELKYGGDNCHNIDRIMRLPGTVNVPDAKKLKKGRSATLAMLIDFFPERVYPLAMFPKGEIVNKTGAPPSEQKATVTVDFGNLPRIDDISELDKYGVSDRVKVICVQGKHPELPKNGDNSRSQWQLDAACQMVRANVPDDVIVSIFLDPEFGISEGIREKGSSAQRYAERQVRRAKEFAKDEVMFEMNQHFAAVNYNAKFRVAEFKPVAEFPYQTFAEFQIKADFLEINKHPCVEWTEGKTLKKMGRGHYFLDHAGRQEYDGIEFRPGAPTVIETKGRGGKEYRILNLYSGFSVEPREGDCSLYLAHVKDNICSHSGGDPEAIYSYVINLMARGVQRPENPSRISVCVRSPEAGTGKGIFATEYGKLFGRHFLHLTQPEHLTGRFNAHSAEAMFEFADEQMNLNDPKIASLMKTHISERTKILERKGIDAIQVPTYSVTWFATNMDHPIKIEEGDRRFYPLRANPARAKDKGYFLPLLDQMWNKSGRAALLHFLLARDLTGFDPESMPPTDELKLQKQLSISDQDGLLELWADTGHLPGALENRPWLALNTPLFEYMKAYGGSQLDKASAQQLTSILKSWGFKRHPMGKGGVAWQAPDLLELRKMVKARRPSTEWEHPEIADWGGKTLPERKASRAKAQDAADAEAQEEARF
jgi:hypothetical protein